MPSKPATPGVLQAAEQVQITVVNVNRPPAIFLPETVTIDEGKLITIPITTSDPDKDILTVTTGSLPENAVFVQPTRTITFAPDYDQAGSYTFECTVSDGDLTATDSASVIVSDVSGASGDPQELTLHVEQPVNPALLTSAYISGTVNSPAGTLPPPQKMSASLIVGMSPATGAQGETLDVTLTGDDSGNFSTNFTQGISQALFGSGTRVNSLTVHSPSQVTASITIDAEAEEGTRSVTVTTGNETAVSVLAFLVTRGHGSLSGTVKDPETGQPLPGAIVTVAGTNLTTTTNTAGSFLFPAVPKGEFTLLINAQNHALITMTVGTNVGTATDVGTIETTSLVYDPSAPPSVSLFSVAGRLGKVSASSGKREEMTELIIDAILLVGGEDAGVLDKFGNQLNPEMIGNGVITLKSDGVDHIVEALIRGQRFRLDDLLFFMSYGTRWKGRGYPLMLREWLPALQKMLDQAWADPFDPNNYLPIVLFNQGTGLSPEPPRITEATTLDPLQTYLFTASFVAYLSSVQTAGNDGKEITNVFAAFMLKAIDGLDRFLAPPVWAQAGGSRFTGYWRNFFESKDSWPVLTMTEGMAQFSFHMMEMMMAPTGGSIAGTGLAFTIAGSAEMDLTHIVGAIGIANQVPEWPTIKRVDTLGPGVAVIHFAPSRDDTGNGEYFYSLFHFKNSESPPRLVQAGVSPLLSGGDYEIADFIAPRNGTSFYAMTVTKSRTLGAMLTTAGYSPVAMSPWWALPSSGVSAKSLYNMKNFGITSDYSPPAFYTAGPQPVLGTIQALAVDPLDGDIYASLPSEKAINRLENKGIVLGDPTLYTPTGFADPGQTGLAVDTEGNLFTDNAASDSLYGGRIFRFKPGGGRDLAGTVNYFSQVLMFAHPVSVGPMAMGTDNRLYVYDKLNEQILAVPVHDDYDPNRRVGKLFFHPDSLAFTDIFDIEQYSDTGGGGAAELYFLDPRFIGIVPFSSGAPATAPFFDLIPLE